MKPLNWDQMTVGEKVRLGETVRATCSYCHQKGKDKPGGDTPVLRQDGWAHDICRTRTLLLLGKVVTAIENGEEPEEVSD